MKATPNPTTTAHLIVEKNDGDLWGRITIKGNLIVESASTLEALKRKMKRLAKDFESVDIESFDTSYDLTSFFTEHPYLSISEIAQKAGINPGLMRQYASGVKFPSEDRVKKIEQGIREIGKKLSRIKLHKREKEFA